MSDSNENTQHTRVNQIASTFYLSVYTLGFFGNASTRCIAGPRSAVGRTTDSLIRGPGFNTQSGHILSFLLPLIQEGQLSVTGENMCTKYWLTAQEV